MPLSDLFSKRFKNHHLQREYVLRTHERMKCDGTWSFDFPLNEFQIL